MSMMSMLQDYLRTANDDDLDAIEEIIAHRRKQMSSWTIIERLAELRREITSLGAFSSTVDAARRAAEMQAYLDGLTTNDEIVIKLKNRIWRAILVEILKVPGEHADRIIADKTKSGCFT